MTTFNIMPFFVEDAALPSANVLSEHQLSLLQDGDTSVVGIPVDASDTIGFVASLHNRFEILEARYWYNGVGTVTIESSLGGQFWEEHPVVYTSSYVAASGTFGTDGDWPRNLRVTHTVTTGSGQGFEFQVKNEPDQHGYWYDGSLDALPVDVNIDSEPTPIQIFNKSGATRDFFVLLDSYSGTDFGETTQLATVSGGPFYSLHGTGIRLPRDVAFNLGYMSGVTTSGSSFLLDTSSGTGVYYSPVFDLDGMNPLRAYLESSIPNDTEIDWSDSHEANGYVSMGVRLHHESPSGGWASGQLPAADDYLWGTLSGSLVFEHLINDTLLEINVGQSRYVQLAVQLRTGTLGITPVVSALGIEESLSVPAIPSNSYGVIFVKTQVDTYAAGDHANLLSFYFE